MIKLTVEIDNLGLSFWVDDVSGALCIEGSSGVIEIPLNTGLELLNTLRQKQAEYLEQNRKGIFRWIG